MILSKNLIQKIEGMLEHGYTVELRCEKGRPSPPGSSSLPYIPEHITIFKRPDSDDEIRIQPTLVNDARPCTVELRTVSFGEDPIILASIDVPAGYCISGIKGHQGISQEIES